MTIATIGGIDPTIGTIPVGSGTSFSPLYPSATSGYILTSNGTGNLPLWQPPTFPFVIVSTDTVMAPFINYICTSSVGTPTFSLPTSGPNVPQVGYTYTVGGMADNYFFIGGNGSLQTFYYQNQTEGNKITSNSRNGTITISCVQGGVAPIFIVLSTNGDSFTISTT